MKSVNEKYAQKNPKNNKKKNYERTNKIFVTES